ncbi:MAG: hypothetical protein FGM46_08585 [Ferruginibacter sp.]|nr:hypothetical protein [Ferruginibacter sp.]
MVTIKQALFFNLLKPKAMKSLKIITTSFFLFISTSSFSQFGTLGLNVNETIEMLKVEKFTIVDSLKEIEYSPDGYDIEKGYVLTAMDGEHAISYYFTKYKICFKTEHVPLTKEAEIGNKITCEKYYKKIGKINIRLCIIILLAI